MTKNNTPTEYEECLVLVNYLELMKSSGKVVVFTHTPQETFTRSIGVKMKNKRMGVRRGIPDYVVVTKKKVLFIEMKRKKGNKATKDQKEWIQAINKVNGNAVVCYGADEAIKYISNNC